MAKVSPMNLDTSALNNELKEIQTELNKLKGFCSNKKPTRSNSLEAKTTKSDKKSLTIEELTCQSAKKSNKKTREITPKAKKHYKCEFYLFNIINNNRSRKSKLQIVHIANQLESLL